MVKQVFTRLELFADDLFFFFYKIRFINIWIQDKQKLLHNILVKLLKFSWIHNISTMLYLDTSFTLL